MRIDVNFSASGDVRSSAVGRTQGLPSVPQVRQRQGEPGADAVDLSALGSELARALNSDPPDVVNQIDQLREAVNSGTFSAPPEQVAASLIRASLAETQPSGGSQAIPSPSG
jgi:hypothetical protein